MVKAVETDQWRSPDVQQYRQLKEEILEFNGLVLRANMIIIPTSLRNKAVDVAHQRSPRDGENQRTYQRRSVVPRNR